jgi:hypothetical protein
LLHLRKSEITDLTLFALTGELCEAFYSVICDIFPCFSTYYSKVKRILTLLYIMFFGCRVSGEKNDLNQIL